MASFSDVLFLQILRRCTGTSPLLPLLILSRCFLCVAALSLESYSGLTKCLELPMEVQLARELLMITIAP